MIQCKISCILICIDNITNGVNAELIRTDAGLLHGIRVSWSWLANVSFDSYSRFKEISTPSTPTGIMCVGLSTLPEHHGRVNISWDLLPCHLQNGADITSYIILYTRLSTGVTTRISSSSRNVDCSQEFGGLYSCVVGTLLIPNKTQMMVLLVPPQLTPRHLRWWSHKYLLNISRCLIRYRLWSYKNHLNVSGV